MRGSDSVCEVVKSAGEIFLDAECGVGDVSGCTWWLFLTSLHDQAGVECGHWVPLLWVIASVAPRLRPLCDADHWLHNNVILITPLWSPPVPDPSPHFLHYCQNWLQPPPCVIMRWIEWLFCLVQSEDNSDQPDIVLTELCQNNLLKCTKLYSAWVSCITWVIGSQAGSVHISRGKEKL